MGEGKGGGSGGLCPGILCAIIWFLLIFVTWMLSFLLSWFYIILLPFSGCCSPVETLEQALLRVIQLPKTCAKNMIEMKPICWGWSAPKTTKHERHAVDMYRLEVAAWTSVLFPKYILKKHLEQNQLTYGTSVCYYCITYDKFTILISLWMDAVWVFKHYRLTAELGSHPEVHSLFSVNKTSRTT